MRQGIWLVTVALLLVDVEARAEKQPLPPDDAAHATPEPIAVPHAEDTGTWEKAYKLARMFEPGTLWYLHFRHGYGARGTGYSYYDSFDIGRGYLTLKFKPLDWFGARITMDAHQDDSGDMKVRLKYLYGKFVIPVETKVVTEPFLEVGLVHMPWLDYEEHINWYRCQGTMFMERNKLFNSADFGVTVGLLLGEKLGKKYQEEVNKEYPGTWGSLALGVYNGGGYHAVEKNTGKSFEARLSVRPLGFIFPNLQLSYFVIVGRGNAAGTREWDPPRWQSHTFMASIEHRVFTLTGQFVTGEGNQKGDFTQYATELDPVTGEEIVTGISDVHGYKGASGYVEIKLPFMKSSLIGRYDYFNRDAKKGVHRIIGGYAFHFFKFHKNLVLVDVDYIINEGGLPDTWETKLTLQVSL